MRHHIGYWYHSNDWDHYLGIEKESRFLLFVQNAILFTYVTPTNDQRRHQGCHEK